MMCKEANPVTQFSVLFRSTDMVIRASLNKGVGSECVRCQPIYHPTMPTGTPTGGLKDHVRAPIITLATLAF